MESKEIIAQSLTVTTQVISPGQVWRVLQKGQQQTALQLLIRIGQELVEPPPSQREVNND